MIEKLNLAQNEIDKLVDIKIKLDKNMFDKMNLKLHDLSYYLYKKEEYYNGFSIDINDEFTWFCEDHYNFFIEDLKESYNIDFDKMVNRIGRTSSFYLHDKNIVDIDNYLVDYIAYNVANEIYGEIDILNENYFKNGKFNIDKIIENQNELEFLNDDLDYIINNIVADFKYYIEDVKIVYDIIHDFKQNQIEIFKENIQNKIEKFINEHIENEKLELENTRAELYKKIVLEDLKDKIKNEDLKIDNYIFKICLELDKKVGEV